MLLFFSHVYEREEQTAVHCCVLILCDPDVLSSGTRPDWGSWNRYRSCRCVRGASSRSWHHGEAPDIRERQLTSERKLHEEDDVMKRQQSLLHQKDVNDVTRKREKLLKSERNCRHHTHHWRQGIATDVRYKPSRLERNQWYHKETSDTREKLMTSERNRRP